MFVIPEAAAAVDSHSNIVVDVSEAGVGGNGGSAVNPTATAAMARDSEIVNRSSQMSATIKVIEKTVCELPDSLRTDVSGCNPHRIYIVDGPTSTLPCHRKDNGC